MQTKKNASFLGSKHSNELIEKPLFEGLKQPIVEVPDKTES